jgi:hypothetical protein
MSQLPQTSQKHPRRFLTKSSLSSEEITQRRAAREEFAARCRPIFEKLRPKLIEDHYNCFIAIEPDSEHYLLDLTLEGIVQKICHEYPDESNRNLAIYCLNENGACGRI